MFAGKRKLGLLLGVLAVAVVTAGVGTAVANSDSEDELTGLLDPFSLTPTETTAVESSWDGSSVAVLSGPRPPVRIPFRPHVRSPFRPPLALR